MCVTEQAPNLNLTLHKDLHLYHSMDDRITDSVVESNQPSFLVFNDKVSKVILFKIFFFFLHLTSQGSIHRD